MLLTDQVKTEIFTFTYQRSVLQGKSMRLTRARHNACLLYDANNHDFLLPCTDGSLDRSLQDRRSRSAPGLILHYAVQCHARFRDNSGTSVKTLFVAFYCEWHLIGCSTKPLMTIWLAETYSRRWPRSRQQSLLCAAQHSRPYRRSSCYIMAKARPASTNIRAHSE